MEYITIEQGIGNTPLVQLRKINTGRSSVLVKLEGNNPAGSVKDRAAMNMIAQGEQRGTFKPGDALIEATSGNTGIALAMVAAIRGYAMTLVMPESASIERRRIMEAYGARLILTPADEGMEGSIDLAREMARRGDGHHLDQFSNPDNPAAHFNSTGPEIWRQTAGEITHFVSAMGTTGTLTGCGRYLREKKRDVRIIGVEPADGARIPGIRAWKEGYLPSFFDPALLSDKIAVRQLEAETTARQMAREEGIFCGISAGGAVYAALTLARSCDGAVIVAIIPDRGDRYLSTGVFGS